MLETTQAERFKYIREELLSYSQTILAKKIGVNQQIIADIERGKTKRLPTEVLKYLATEHLINLEWLLFGFGEPSKVIQKDRLLTIIENNGNEILEKNIQISKGNSCGSYDVPYWEGLPEDLRRPQITEVYSDLQLINTDWLSKPENLRTIPMLGDSMNTYSVPLKNKNMLIFDTSITDINKSGVYLFTTNNGNNLYIRFLSLNMDGSVKITAYKNNEQITKTLTSEQQEEYDFKVIGRIIINASLTM